LNGVVLAAPTVVLPAMQGSPLLSTPPEPHDDVPGGSANAGPHKAADKPRMPRSLNMPLPIIDAQLTERYDRPRTPID